MTMVRFIDCSGLRSRLTNILPFIGDPVGEDIACLHVSSYIPISLILPGPFWLWKVPDDHRSYVPNLNGGN
jgi:hypothetical protein